MSDTQVAPQPKRPRFGEADTRPTRPLKADTAQMPIFANLAPGLTVAAGSDVGRKRRRNEDAYWIADTEFCGRSDVLPIGICVLADGMGGHEKGDVASTTATRIVAGYVTREFLVPFIVNHEQDTNLTPISEVLVRAIETANVIVSRQAPNSGTTLTVALVLTNRVYLAHVGDTRAYVLSQGALRQITQDHSLKAQIEARVKTDPNVDTLQVNRNILYKALGQEQSVEVDTYLHDLPPASCLLMCTDGLWDKVPEGEILDTMCEASTPAAAVQQLIDKANQTGGDDNITAILVARGPAS